MGAVLLLWTRSTGCRKQWPPICFFCQNLYNQWHFISQMLHTHDTHVDHFWCLISKYTEYDNIFINYSLKFCNKKFQPKWSFQENCYKRVQRHINIKLVTLNVQCPPALNTHACSRLRKFWTALVTGFLRKVIPDHLQYVLSEAPRLLMAYLSSLWYPACDRLSAWHPTHDNQAD